MNANAPGWIRSEADGLRIEILVQPRASRNETIGVHDGRLKIRLKAPPVDGAANKALIAFLAATLHIPKSDIRIRSGQSGRRKSVHIRDLTIKQAAGRLGIEG